MINRNDFMIANYYMTDTFNISCVYRIEHPVKGRDPTYPASETTLPTAMNGEGFLFGEILELVLGNPFHMRTVIIKKF